MPFRRALTFSLIINLFFLALCLIFGDLKFGAVDDYFMAARLTGALGSDYNPHLIFVNAIYGYALLPLYHLFPKIGWYYIGEMAAVFISFTSIGYVLLRKCGENWGVILAALFTALFASDFYLVVQFTQCASILSAAGMLLFAYGVISNKKTKESVIPFAIGIILMLWGSVMRWQAFLMGMPFFCLGMLFLHKECWIVKWRIIASIVVLFSAAFALHAFNQNIYKVPEYAAFNKFQSARVTLGDGNKYNQNAVYEDAEELGLNGNDFHMLIEWMFYDTEVFSVDSLKRYTDIIAAYKDKNEPYSIPQIVLASLSHSLHAPLFWVWFIFCIVIYATQRSKFLYLWGSLLLILGFITYLLTIGRLVYRVESGFWLYAATLSIPLFGQFTLNLPRKIIASLITIIAMINIYAYATSGEIVRDPSSGNTRTIAIEDSTDYKQVFGYIDSNPDKMFLLSMNAFMRFSHHKNPPYIAEPISSFRNIISFGYWTPYLPEVTKDLADFSITNPIKDVIHDNVTVINAGNLQDFLQRHYYDSVTVDTLKVFGEMSFFKYRLMPVAESLIKGDK